ncbi:hypothetical protein D3C78_1263570 [compost metagenome]
MVREIFCIQHAVVLFAGTALRRQAHSHPRLRADGGFFCNQAPGDIDAPSLETTGFPPERLESHRLCGRLRGRARAGQRCLPQPHRDPDRAFSRGGDDGHRGAADCAKAVGKPASDLCRRQPRRRQRPHRHGSGRARRAQWLYPAAQHGRRADADARALQDQAASVGQLGAHQPDQHLASGHRRHRKAAGEGLRRAGGSGQGRKSADQGLFRQQHDHAGDG